MVHFSLPITAIGGSTGWVKVSGPEKGHSEIVVNFEIIVQWRNNDVWKQSSGAIAGSLYPYSSILPVIA
jgi:hypothetical protein